MDLEPDPFGGVVLDDGPVDATTPETPWFDLVVALVLTLCTAFWGDLLGSGPHRADYLASVLTSIGLVMPLALRRSHPLVMTAMMALAGLGQAWLVDTPTWALIAVPLATYSVARWVAGRSSRLVVLAGGIGSFIGPLRWASDTPDGPHGAEMVPIVGPLIALCLAWAWGVGTRSPLLAEVLRDRNALYRETATGIENSYTLKLANKTDAPARFRIELDAATPGLALRGGSREVVLPPQQLRALPVVVVGPADTRGRHALSFIVVPVDGGTPVEVESSFFGAMQ